MCYKTGFDCLSLFLFCHFQSVSTETKLFRHLVTTWRFSPGYDDNPDTCTLDYKVSVNVNVVMCVHVSVEDSVTVISYLVARKHCHHYREFTVAGIALCRDLTTRHLDG